MAEQVFIRKGREYPIQSGQKWIFSGSIEKAPKKLDGDILPVFDHNQKLLGHAYFNSKTNIAGRMVSFGNVDPIKTIISSLRRAIDLRTMSFRNQATNAYRLVNGEADGLPGLIVDKYAETLVMQISTLGMNKLKKLIIDNLVELLDPVSIFEKSVLPSRKLEGLKDELGFVYVKSGRGKENVTILENGFKFEINLINSHKTGFYLDQREMRKLVGSLSEGKRVLNCFSYTGGFSIYAAKHGAKSVDSVDISAEVTDQAMRNFELNDIDAKNNHFYSQDVFKFLAENELKNYDIVILDPPAFAKKQEDISAATSGYRKLNSMVMERMKPGSILLTCSCSHYINEEMFLQILRQALHRSGRTAKLLSRHIDAPDHLIDINHIQSEYLKSFLLAID